MTAGDRARSATRKAVSTSLPALRRVGWFASALTLLLASPLTGQLPPDADWRSFETPHFRVTFAAGLEAMARGAAARAERAHAALSAELVSPPPGRIELVLSDNVDFANGYATLFPTNRIVVYAHPPIDTPELSFYEDWLDLVIVHELAHVFHLDVSRGIWSALRRVLGRNPALFPGATVPPWLSEGIATYLESRLTGAGRVRGTLQEMMLRTAILEDAFFTIDRVTGSPTTWPSATSRYLYGSMFVDHLARAHGPAGLTKLVETYAASPVPYLLDSAASRALDRSFSAGWRSWTEGLHAGYSALADSLRRSGITEPEVLTEAGRVASFPRYAPDGSLAYSAATGREQPDIRLIEAAGERTLQKVAQSTSFAFTPDGGSLVYGDLAYADPYRIYSDLWIVDRTGQDRPLTDGARLTEPDVGPDGRSVVAVANAGETNALVVLDLAGGGVREVVPPSSDTHWSLPRWSPSGELIAATRWSAGGLSDVVILDASGRVAHEVTRDRALDTAPTWTPDGEHIVFSSDRLGIANLYLYRLETRELWRATSVLTGAFSPAVSPDGRWIAFSYYRADGYHIARIPFDPAAWRPASAPSAALSEALPTRDPAPTGGETRPYSPWPSLLPASWDPLAESRGVLGWGFGAALSGQDVVERHLWRAEGRVYPGSGRGELFAGYRYRGLGNPILDLAGARRWDVVATRDGAGKALPTPLLRREREAALSVGWMRRWWSSTGTASLGASLTDSRLEWDDPGATTRAVGDVPADLGAIAQATLSSARGFGISLGPQTGGALSLRAEGHRYLERSDEEAGAPGYSRVTGRVRRFASLPLPGFARHVLALRLDLAGEIGRLAPGLGAGGAAGAGLGTTLGVPFEASALGGRVDLPVRGYPEDAQRGNRAFSAGVEYRFPLLLVERGYRFVPLFLDRVWGDLFIDSGGAWCAGPCRADLPASQRSFAPLVAVGAELNVDIDLAYQAALPIRFGAALPLREVGSRSPRLYLRLGRSF